MQLLVLLVLLAARPVRGLADGADQPPTTATLQRDPLLEAPLRDLLLTPLAGDAAAQLEARLQGAFVQCRELGVTSFMYESGNDSSGGALPPLGADDAAYCNRLRYVRHQRQHFRGVWQELATQTEEPEAQQLETRAVGDVNFQEFFELYAEKTRPVVLQLNDGEEDPVAQLLGLDETRSSEADEAAASPKAMEKFLSACFSSETQQGRARSLRVEDEACAALLETTFRVPIYMTHDYVQRTNASREEAFLPAIIELPSELDAPESAKDIVACPYGLHMLAIPLGDDTVGGVRVSLFDRKFEPIAPPSLMRGQLWEVALGADANVAASTEATVLDAGLFQRAPELYSAIELEPGRSMIFVPGGVVSTMRTSTSSQAVKVLRFCYCDAANVKGVKQAAGLDALLMTSDNKDEAVYGLLHALETPDFDSTFSRRPTNSDTSWSTFVKWPRDPAYLARKNRRHKSGGANGDDQEGEEEQLSRRERLKQWQDDKRWERYIASLTLPVAWPPIVVNTTRTTATLRWQELYQPLKHDLTSYGYEISWKREADGSVTEGPAVPGELENTVTVTYDQITRSRMPSTLFGDDFDGRDLEAVITGLQAEMAYSFSVRLVVGEAQGAVSGASRRVVTSPCAPPSPIRGVPEAGDVEETCLTLRWLDTEDDGGKEIELYLVSMEKLPEKGEQDDLSTGRGADNGALVREHEKIIAVNSSISNGQVTAERLSSGALWLSTKVCGLFPGAAYTFRVAAMNVLGAGFWSHRSSRVEIAPRRRLSSLESGDRSQPLAVPTLKGVGDPGYTVVSGVDILSQSDLSALIAQDPHRILRASGAQTQDATLPRVVLSDVKEQVQLLSSNASEGVAEVERSFEAWSSHHSPRLFDVSAELVLADPPDASQPLRNAHAVRDRVLLAVRGGVPFVFKLHFAQRAGALGLIIADADGVCGGGFDQSCVPGADKRRGEGFAAQERHALWREAQIPCVLVLKDTAQELLERLGGASSA
ncbi:hypothetical protein PF005_g25928 [Phytophthora fragariae]|uniref:Fibronectin type-III domain-containing protein n=1 Tax=Phytophthora fragariae TaxID=53985 RepID=A0A6A3WNU9_9STRA|nr:hypothetical protein PF003_g17236 [Phytophthora fragariae]KAE8923310.1 hypothetical protein PF009_g26440 [Phytophthora fragariae]KAE8974831.1 hypothetical protein PF011_g24715 [Phytophthora fragariae]KAE9072891.1 hypothetical protein PF010_g25303 [Phytophthora fragariae]KAE9072954.1 hypothetical protein PF007_g25991 [Phytophthora fragariae]